MRIILLFLSIMIAGVVTHAQTRSDFIYRLDQTGFSAIIDEIGETDIIYFLTTDTAKRTPMRIARAQVWKLIYANGDIEIINAPTSSSSTPRSVVNETPDHIFLKNKTTLKGKVLKISEQSIEYRQKDNGPVYELSRNEVTKIEYSNGEVRAFEDAVKNSKKNNSHKSKSMAKKREDTKNPSYIKKSKNSDSNLPKSPKFSATIAFVGSYILKEAYWKADTNGAGLRKGIGGVIDLNYRLSKTLALTLQAGYNQFQTNRVYLTPTKETIYTAKTSLIAIPIQLGFKVYLTKNTYIGMTGGMNYLTTNFSSYRDYNLQTMRFSPSGIAALGFAPRLGSIKLDMAIQYNYSTVKSTGIYSSSPPIHIPQLKLGIGF